MASFADLTVPGLEGSILIILAGPAVPSIDAMVNPPEAPELVSLSV